MTSYSQDRPYYYQIIVAGHLNPKWSDWLDDLMLTHQEDGTTMLSGLVLDQAALYGLLIKIRDLGLTLLAVNRKTDLSSGGATRLEPEIKD